MACQCVHMDLSTHEGWWLQGMGLRLNINRQNHIRITPEKCERRNPCQRVVLILAAAS